MLPLFLPRASKRRLLNYDQGYVRFFHQHLTYTAAQHGFHSAQTPGTGDESIAPFPFFHFQDLAGRMGTIFQHILRLNTFLSVQDSMGLA